MDDVAFDFERGLEHMVGQPVEPPASMPAAGRKNYRMVSTRVCAPARKLCSVLTRGMLCRRCAATGCAGCA
jgi:hypothetical protein